MLFDGFGKFCSFFLCYIQMFETMTLCPSRGTKLLSGAWNGTTFRIKTSNNTTSETLIVIGRNVFNLKLGEPQEG